MIKNIIFDLGAVIIDQPANLSEVMIQGMFPSSFSQAYLLWESYRKSIGIGEKSLEDFLQNAKKQFFLKKDISVLHQQWVDIYKRHAKVNQPMIELLDFLKKSYSLFILTDIIEDHFYFANSHHIFDHVNQVFASFKEGYWKEDGKAFGNILTKLHLDPKACLFIDDLEENILLAKTYNIEGIVFRNIHQLKKDLKDLRIL